MTKAIGQPTGSAEPVDPATLDTATPDTATPDTATPDTATPDTATPDTATPDTATPDTATPDTGAGAADRPASSPERPPGPPGRLRTLLSFLRNTWRGLVSMRTALVLLFLLALAALPGALLPQRSLNPAKITEYRQQHPTLGPVLDRLGFFDVFASPWFAAIYLLLFVSLVGCLGPRAVEYAKACRARPVVTPRNLSRLPHYAIGALPDEPEQVVQRVRGRLRGWRTEVREERDADGHTGYTVSAEKGYLREAGNLVFHLALVGLLIGFAVGRLFGYQGQVIVLTGGNQFCNSGILGYDSFTAGALVDGTSLTPFCVKVDTWDADYLPNGQPEQYRAQIGYQTGSDLAAGPSGPWHPYLLKVNSPLRITGDRVYLLGNGYAPTFTVTFPNGTVRTQTIQWRPVDQGTMLSEGATKFDRPDLPDEASRRANQLAVTGLLAPTSSGGKVVTSVYPAALRPEVAVDVLRGDLGLDDGRGQSIFEVPQSQLTSGAVHRVARQNLFVGEQLRLDDGTTVRFDGVVPWVGLQVSHDPAEHLVLVFAVLVLLGLGTSLTVKRRRFWARIRLAGPRDGSRGVAAVDPEAAERQVCPVHRSDQRGRTVLEIGGLARTDQAGYGEEFTRLRTALLGDPTRAGADDGNHRRPESGEARPDASQRDAGDL